MSADLEAKIATAVQKGIADTMLAFGIEEDARKEVRADFAHPRRWRRATE